MDAFNAGNEQAFRLSMSLGAAVSDDSSPPDLDRLVEAADRAMYEDERRSGRRRDDPPRSHA